MYMGAMVSVTSCPRVPLVSRHRLHEALTQDTAFTALGKVLHLLNGILDGQVGAPGMGRGRPWSWGQGPYPGKLDGAEPHGSFLEQPHKFRVTQRPQLHALRQ